jgi:hypothetical protein
MLKPAPSSPPARAVRESAGLVLVLLSAPLLLPLAGCGPSSGSRPTAWQEAPLARARRPADDPVTLSLWANELAPLLRQGEGLGPPPHSRAALLRWLAAQCRINQALQAVQRRHGKPVDPERDLGRPSYCHDLELVRRRL